jgi:hypothetical protein
MKFYESHYEDYLIANEKYNLHPELNFFMESLPNKIYGLENIIFYGPTGSGKYTQVLKILKKYSPSELKYDKKITVQTEKQEYIYRISDIHFEIDMSLLGCNSKILWNEIFLQIVDIISVKQDKVGIILCKNFHLIHTELLEIFYSYMQQYNFISSNIKIKFFIISEHLSFIPTNIIFNSFVLRIQRPNKDKYIEYSNKLLLSDSDKNSINTIFQDIDIDNILNIKEIHSFTLISLKKNIPNDIFNIVCDNIINFMLEPNNIVFTTFRDTLYEILTYNLDMVECLWYIFKFFIDNHFFKKQSDISDILIKIYSFLKYFNNNYRPIYHIESIIFYIINKIHQYNEIS